MAPAFLALLVLLSLVSPAAAANPPNILLIFSDDQGYGDVGCYGSEIPTPNIDSLARDGIKFTSWYVAGPTCTPSRYGLLTGRVPNRSLDQLLSPLMTALDRDRDRGLRPGETTLASLLKKRDYRTALIGKWHLGHGDDKFLPTRHGFDSFYGHSGGCIDYFTLKYGYLRTWYRNEKLLDESGYATDLLTDEAVRFIQEQEAQQPFFLYLAYNAPHFGKAWDGDRKEFLNILQAKPEDLAEFQHVKNEDRRIFSAMVKSLDDGIGRVLTALNRKGIEKNTLVIFMTDHGGPPAYGARNGPLRGGKGSLEEGGIRVPCLMRWPGSITPGSINHQPCSALDLLPTLCNMLDIDTEEMTLDGVNIGDTIFNGKPVQRDLYWSMSWGNAYRRGHWKYLQRKDRPAMLFDLESDPGEKTNLADKNPKKLRQLMDAHRSYSVSITSGNR